MHNPYEKRNQYYGRLKSLQERCTLESLRINGLTKIGLVLSLCGGGAVVPLFYGVICRRQTDHIQVQRTTEPASDWTGLDWTGGIMQMTKIGEMISTGQLANRDRLRIRRRFAFL